MKTIYKIATIVAIAVGLLVIVCLLKQTYNASFITTQNVPPVRFEQVMEVDGHYTATSTDGSVYLTESSMMQEVQQNGINIDYSCTTEVDRFLQTERLLSCKPSVLHEITLKNGGRCYVSTVVYNGYVEGKDVTADLCW